MDTESLLYLLTEGAKEIGIHLSKAQKDVFIAYLERLKIWSHRVGLTSVRYDEEIIIKHFLDSLTCLAGVQLTIGMKVIDVGSGAGFPGVPLRIYQPGIKLTLLDANHKRTAFLEDICKKLSLSEVEIIWGRAEEYGQNVQYREGFDVAVSRAVASMNVLCEYCLPFLKIGGKAILQKGRDVNNELKESEKAMELLGGKIEKDITLSLPIYNYGRTLIVLSKVNSTPCQYPRRAGIPRKRPLGINKRRLSNFDRT